MATPTPRRPDSTSRYPPRPAATPPENIDPRWLLKALGLTIGGAAVLGYLAVCLLIYQGGWQRMLSPSPKIDRTPAAFGTPFETVHFDAGTSGKPRLTAWWIPSDSATAPTILFLHDGAGSLSAAVPTLELLRRADVNIFAIDYRGYGASDGPHATEERMLEDSSAALDYLTKTRHIDAAHIVPYGLGLGAVLATRLSNAHPELTALIIDQPDPGAFARVIDEDRSRLLPMRLLVQEHFDITAALAQSKTPKLLLADSAHGSDAARTEANQALFRNAPEPKLSVTFGNAGADDTYLVALHRFLDAYVHAAR
jgi:pimeloyl-ACP methyl ester carboxylesterase